jgi:hypothetical protein
VVFGRVELPHSHEVVLKLCANKEEPIKEYMAKSGSDSSHQGLKLADQKGPSEACKEANELDEKVFTSLYIRPTKSYRENLHHDFRGAYA